MKAKNKAFTVFHMGKYPIMAVSYCKYQYGKDITGHGKLESKVRME
jgi:hypothetical protein